ncbi:unnamed protein product, partial [Mesorhabditis spiculigera]
MEIETMDEDRCFVARDYSKGLAVQFDTEVPDMLQGRVREADWRRTIRAINEKFTEAERIDRLLAQENKEVYGPVGVHILNPMFRGLRVIEITVKRPR